MPRVYGAGPLKPGDTFDKFKIRGLLGEGGQAFVYEAEDGFLNQEVALKVIPVLPGSRRSLPLRARNEARLLRQIDHPNVVKVFDANATGEFIYIVMERVRGRSLRAVLREVGRLSEMEAVYVGMQVAAGMAAAHQNGVVHRDLKPENVIIGPKNSVKLVDFGIAKLLEEPGPTTRQDYLLGTLMYMAPEYLKGLGVTHRADVFALGVMLFEMMTGHHYTHYRNQQLTLEQVGQLQISWMPPPLHKLDRAVSRQVSKAVERAMKKRPEQRWDDMSEFGAALQELLNRLSKEVKPGRPQPLYRDLSVPSHTAEWLGPAPDQVPRRGPAKPQRTGAGYTVRMELPGADPGVDGAPSARAHAGAPAAPLSMRPGGEHGRSNPARGPAAGTAPRAADAARRAAGAARQRQPGTSSGAVSRSAERLPLRERWGAQRLPSGTAVRLAVSIGLVGGTLIMLAGSQWVGAGTDAAPNEATPPTASVAAPVPPEQPIAVPAGSVAQPAAEPRANPPDVFNGRAALEATREPAPPAPPGPTAEPSDAAAPAVAAAAPPPSAAVPTSPATKSPDTLTTAPARKPAASKSKKRKPTTVDERLDWLDDDLKAAGTKTPTMPAPSSSRPAPRRSAFDQPIQPPF